MLTFRATYKNDKVELDLVEPTFNESITSDDYLIQEGLMTISCFAAPDLKNPDLTLKDRIEKRYESIGGFNFIKDVTIGEHGRWIYPGDPIIDPLFKFIDYKDEHLYFYRYSLLAIKLIDSEGYYTTRID